MKAFSANNARNVHKIDPLVRNLTSKKVATDVAEFEQLLNSNAWESKLQQFLSEHSYFFSGMIDAYSPSPLYSKVKLGHDYEVDFSWLYFDSFGPEWRLIEIENPSSTLFTKSGNPSSALSHAMQQVRDWCSWIHDHAEYARKLMPRISYPLCYIFLGRRRDITASNRERLKKLRYDCRSEIVIHTLDWFVRSGQNFGQYIGPDGPTWQIPMKALTHRDLKKGLPEEVQHWVADERSEMMTGYRLDHRLARILVENDPSIIGTDTDI
jgi:hypothetical protein